MNRIIILFAILFGTVNLAYSQSGYSLGKLSNVSQAGFNFDPSLGSDNKFMIALPVIGGVGGSIISTGFSYNDLVQDQQIDAAKVISEMPQVVDGYGRLKIDLLQGGFHFGNMWFRVGVSDQVNMLFRLDQDVADLAWNGNSSAKWVGKEVEASNTRAFGIHFREYKAGVSMPLPVFDKFRVGANLRAIQGLSAVYTSDMEIQVAIDGESYIPTTTVSYNVHTSGSKYYTDTLPKNDPTWQEYAFKQGNWGFGVDLGASYQATEKLKFEASVLNLGKIWWKKDLENYKAERSQYSYEGIELSELLDSPDWETFIENEAQEVESKYLPDTLQEEFTTKLNARYNLGINVEIIEGGNAYANYMRSTLFDRTLQQMVIGYRQDVKKWFSVTVNGGLFNGDIYTVGAGMMFRFKPVQIYLATDNVLGWIDPYDNKAFNGSFGINLVFGEKK